MTTYKVKCNTCRGTKIQKGMGGIMRECRTCDGRGYTLKEEKEKEQITEICGSDIGSQDTPLVTMSNDPLPNRDIFEVEQAVIPEKASNLELKKKEEEKPVKTPAEQLGELAGFTSYMVQAIMDEPAMEPMKWRNKYSSIILDPLAVNAPTGKQLLPDAAARRAFRESVAMQQPTKPRKVNNMKAQNEAAKLAGIKDE